MLDACSRIHWKGSLSWMLMLNIWTTLGSMGGRMYRATNHASRCAFTVILSHISKGLLMVIAPHCSLGSPSSPCLSGIFVARKLCSLIAHIGLRMPMFVTICLLSLAPVLVQQGESPSSCHLMMNCLRTHFKYARLLMHLGTGEQLQVMFINWLLVKLLPGLWICILEF